MPNSNLIDERVVQMRMDNEQFEKGAERTMSTLEKLKKSLNFKDTKIGDLGTSAIEKSIDKIANKFNALQIAGKRAIENITDSAMHMAKQALTASDQITPGFNKYEQQVASVQKLINATGESMDAVQKVSDKILKFTDETSYEYNAMMSTMASFTSSGMGMEEAANTILGLAIAAGKSGVNAKDATHAFMGFQKAISSGYMKDANWDWIRTAGMNTADLKRELLEAAVATGDLVKGADGVYYALEETKKGVKETAVTVENFEQSFAQKWLTKPAMILAAAKYVKAFNQIMDIRDETGLDVYQIKGENSPYLKFLDQWSLEAFNAGQETKTWSDAVEALKSTMSSGWMKSFELIIGNYRQAADFFTDLIEPLYQIFIGPGERRNSLLTEVFSKNTAKYVVNWEKLTAKVKETGHSVQQLENAFQRVTSSSENEKVQQLAIKYNTLQDAIKAGAVDAETLTAILNDMGVAGAASVSEMSDGIVDATEKLKEYKDVAAKVLRGDYGSGEERRSAIEGLGMDYELVQWFAGNLEHGKGFDAITVDWLKTVAPNAYQRFINSIANGNVVINGATGQVIKLSDVVDNLGDELSTMTGRDLWQQGVINIVQGLADALDEISEAFNDVFGDAKERAKGFRGILESFYKWSQKYALKEDGLAGVRQRATSFFKTFKGLKNIPSKLKTILGSVLKLKEPVFAIVDKVLSLFTKEKVEAKFGTLGSILEKLGNIIGKVFDKIAKVFNISDESISKFVKKVHDFSFTDFFKPITDFLHSDSPIATMINDLTEPFKKLFGGEGEGSFLDRIKNFFKSFTESSDDMTQSIDILGTRVSGLEGTFSRIAGFTDTLTEGMTGDEKTFKEKISMLFENIKKFVVEKYRSINWGTLLSAGKVGVLGLVIYRINEFSTNLNKTIKNITTTGGPLGALKLLVTNFTMPFVELSKAIRKYSNANQFLSIALAIGVLAGSIYLLTKIGNDQAFFNAVVSIGILMAIMSKMAKNLNGMTLLNVNKNISKNNPVQNTVKAFEALTKAFTVDLTGAKFNLNVFSNAAQILIGIAIAIVAIVHAFNKLRDIKSLDEVLPALYILGGILAYLAIFVPIMSAVAEKSKYAGQVGVMMVALALTINMLANTLIKIGTIQNIDWTAVGLAFGGMIVVMIAIRSLLKISTGFVRQGKSFITSGAAIIAIAGVILSIGILIRSLVKTISIASQIQNVEKGLAIVAGVFVGIAAIFAIIDFLTKKGDQGAKMLKIAGAIMILALAIGVLVPAIILLSRLGGKEVLKGAGAIAAVLVGLAVALLIIQQIDTKSLLVAATVLALLAIVLGAVMLAVGSFIGTMVGLAQLPWVEMQAKFQAMHDVLSPMLPLFLGLGLAAALLGIGLFGAATASGVFGLSFLAIAAGIYLVSAALPKLIDGIIYFMDRLQENGWKVVAFIGLILTAIMIATIAKKKEFMKVIASYADSFLTMLSNSAFLHKLFNVLALVLMAALTFLRAITPELVDKVIDILIAFINSLADAIRSNAKNIASAFWNLISALLNLVWELLIQGLGALGTLIAKLKDRFNIGGGIQTAYALDTEHMDILTNQGVLEQKAVAAAESDKQVVNNAYMSTWESGTSLGGFTYTGLPNESQTQTILDTVLPSSDALSGNAEAKGAQDAAAVQQSYSDGFTQLIDTSGGLFGKPRGLLSTSGDPLPDGVDTILNSFDLGGTSGLDSNLLGGDVMSFLSGSLGGQETLTAAGDGGTDVIGSWLGSLTSGLTDSANIESIMGGIRSFFGSTINSEEATTIASESGTELANTMTNSISTGLSNEDVQETFSGVGESAFRSVQNGWQAESDVMGYSMMMHLAQVLFLNAPNEDINAVFTNTGVYINDVVRFAWNEQTDGNAILMTKYLASHIWSEIKADAPRTSLHNTGTYSNDVVRFGWEEMSNANAPIMVDYLVSGLEMAFYNDPAIHERLMAIGAQIYNEVEQGMRNQAGIESPSKAMAQNGVYMMQGLVNGLYDASGEAYDAGSGISGSLLDTFGAALMQMSAMLDDNMNIQPTITPVVDMSNVESAASEMNSAFGSGYNVTAEMSNGIRSSTARAQQAMPAQNAASRDAASQSGDNVTVNVYPSQGMDERALADKVMYRMAERLQRRRVVTGA